MGLTATERQELRRLAAIVDVARRLGLRRVSDRQLEDLPRLYRRASSFQSRLETQGHDPVALAEVRPLVVHAHGLLHAGTRPEAGPWPRRLARYYLQHVPRTLRGEWRLLATTFGLVYGLALVAWLAVSRDLSLAYSLLSPAVVDQEIEQLRATADGAPFRGNFTFGLGESAGVSGFIIANNLRVAVTFFALALLPPFYVLVLALNSLMLGTYTAVAGHWGQAGAISSVLWCHGVLEIQAIVLAGTGGLVLLRAWVAPGPWTRRHAMRIESRRAFAVLAPVFPMLLVAGWIEGYVSPHAPPAVRVAVAVLSGVALLAWALLGGRVTGSDAPPARP